MEEKNRKLGGCYVLLLAGGSGTRFWPYSRRDLPKQFLPLLAEESLLQQTYLRALQLAPADHIYLLTDVYYAEKIKEQLPSLPAENIILEPANKDTAPCLALAASMIVQQDQDAMLLVLPSDHFISDNRSFQKTVEKAMQAAKGGAMVTIGIQPNFPNSAYGYIEKGAEAGEDIFTLQRFVEKPCRKDAEFMLAQGNYLWNSGIYITLAKSLLQAVSVYLPAFDYLLQGWQPIENKEDALWKEEYHLAPAISIDYGIMEKNKNAFVIPASFAWDDLGGFEALAKYLPKDIEGNCLDGGDWLGIDCQNCLISSDEGLVAAMGLQDLLIIRRGDIVLVAPRAKNQEIKKLVMRLKNLADGKYL